MKFLAEYTDTFGGDANYSWVMRETFEAPDDASDRMVLQRARKAIGLTGVRGAIDTFGDTLLFAPYGRTTVLFVYPVPQ